MSEQTWNQDSIYIFVSYLKVLAASTSLFPVSITCHALPEKAHTTPCPLALKMVANLKLFTLSLYHRHTMPSRCRETCRPRRSGITAIAQPTVVVQPKPFPRDGDPYSPYDTTQSLGYCCGKFSLVSHQVNLAKW